MPRRFKLRAQNFLSLDRRNGKGDQRGRDIAVQETAGHGILPADRGSAELKLRIECTEQRRERFAPTRGIIAQLFKEFLKTQISLAVISARRYQLRHGSIDGVMCTAIAVCRHGRGVEAPAHDAGIIAVLSGQNRKQRRHGLGGAALGFSAEGNEHASGPDAAVKALHQATAACAFQAGRHLPKVGGRMVPLI